MPTHPPQWPIPPREAALRHLAAAAAHLAPGRSDERDVHEARRHLKRARALLALLRHGLAGGEADALRAELRRAHQALAAPRERVVLAALLAKVAKACAQPAPRLPARAYAAARPRPPASRRAAPVALRAASRRLGARGAECGERDLKRAMRRLYRRGRDAFRRARAARSDLALHACRKRTQRLVHALDYLQPRLPGRLLELRRDARLLAAALGDANDCTQLQRVLACAALPLEPRRRLGAELHRRHERLAERAIRRGALVYARHAASFGDLL